MKDADAKKNGSRPQPVYIDSLGDDAAKHKSPEYIKRKGKISRFYTWCMEKTLPQKKKFAAGLIGFPIFVLLLSFLLVFISELLTTHESDESQKLESININGDTYVVHEFQMPSEFQNDYPSHNYWRVTVYFETFGGEREFTEETRYQHGGPDPDNSGSMWNKTEGGGKDDTYVQVNGDKIRIASLTDTPVPSKVAYYWEADRTTTDLFSFTLYIWPISTILVAVLGFVSKRPEFSYGVLISGGIVTLAYSVIFFDLIFCSCGDVLYPNTPIVEITHIRGDTI